MTKDGRSERGTNLLTLFQTNGVQGIENSLFTMNNSPFHNSNSNPLPDANDIEREFLELQESTDDAYNPASDPASRSLASQKQFEADKRRLRNFLLSLLAIGLLLGGVLSVGLVWVMGRLNLIEPNRIEQPRQN